MGMYQTIDDADEASTLTEGPTDSRPGSKGWVLASMGVALLTLVFVIWASLPGGSPDPAAPAGPAAQDARAAYLAAISEPSPALRRARLTDFAQVHPTSSRADAVRAQLETLDAHEASAWARVTDALFDTRATRLDKIAALDTYEAVWGPDLLGERRDEIAALRDGLAEDDEDDTTPSRQLEEDPSPIPPSINAGSMAGGPVVSAPELPPVVVLPTPERPVPPVTRSARAETPPRVVSSPKPKYPRSALRRGVEAVVVVSMDIDAKGRVRDTRVVSVDAPRYGKDFARSARRAAKRTRFDPRRVDGEALPTMNVTKRYRFQL